MENLLRPTPGSVLTHTHSELIIHRELISAVNIKFRYFPLPWVWSGSYCEGTEVKRTTSILAHVASATLMTKPKTFEQLTLDPRVADFSDERQRGRYNEGIWLYLMPGWVVAEGHCASVHEWTVKECADELARCRYSPDTWVDSCLTPEEAHPLLPAG